MFVEVLWRIAEICRDCHSTVKLPTSIAEIRGDDELMQKLRRIISKSFLVISVVIEEIIMYANIALVIVNKKHTSNI